MTSKDFSTSNSYIKYNITVTVESQDAITNTSRVRVSVDFRRTNTGYETYGTGTVYCTIDGNQYTSNVRTSQIIDENGVTLFDETVTVYHNNDGTKNLTVSCRINHSRFTSSANSYTCTLPALSSASTAEIVGRANVGSTVTVQINRTSSNYLHTLQYSVGGGGFVEFARNVEASYQWLVPSALADAIPGGTQGTAILRVITLLDGSIIGTRDTEFTFYVAEEYGSPTLRLTASQTNRAGINAYIANESTVTVHAVATMMDGATTRQYSFTVNGTIYTVRDTNSVYDYVFLLPNIDSSEITITATVTDSRGYTSEPASLRLQVYQYRAPEITSIRFARGYYANGLFTEDVNGNRIRISASGTISSLNNQNAKRCKAEYRVRGSESFSQLFPETDLSSYQFSLAQISSAVFSADLAYDVRFTISDSMNSVTEVLSVNSQRVLMNFSADGRSICVGGMATYPDTFESRINLYPSGGITATEITSGQNLDSLTTSGWYYGEDSQGKFGLYVEQIGSNAHYQRRHRYNGDKIEADVRCAVNSFWGPWEKAEIGFENTTLESITTEASTGSIVYVSDGKMGTLTPPGTEKMVLTSSTGSNPDWVSLDSLVEGIKNEMLEMLYPIGSLYMSTNSTSPETLFGGSWQQIEDVFLLAAGSSHSAGSTGGSESQSVSIAGHHHRSPVVVNGSSGSYAIGISATGCVSPGTGSVSDVYYAEAKHGSSYSNVRLGNTGTAGAHNVNVDTMPPYLAVYVWERIG